MGPYLIVLSADVPMSDADWDGVVAAVAASPARRKSLVIAGRFGPNAKQRKRLADSFAGHPTTAAVMTSSAIALGIVTAMSLFVPSTKAFKPTDFEGAFRHLDVPPQDRGMLLRVISSLKAELGISASEPTERR